MEFNSDSSDSFKKPVFVAKNNRQPKNETENCSISKTELETKPKLDEVIIIIPDPNAIAKQNSDGKFVESVPSDAPYKEPKWSGPPQSASTPYALEVLKNGLIIENIDLMKKPFYVCGRQLSCDICMQHPTVSRFHAVIQYRAEATESEAEGFYIYDLGSTHGTFLNKLRLKPKVYARLKVGHVLKLGCSSRMLILNGPSEDEETESEFTVTELKQQRQDELRKRDELIAEEERKEEAIRKKREEAGVDWGMGEDANEEADLLENPYAQTNNEELYLENPKNTLRGFFEREGLSLDYDCKEQGIGQFFCRIEMPIDDEMGRPLYAEVTHKGKKKDAVVQCALEACRILDRHGLLRQATHESRKRKPKNWEENDFYDSDDDTYLDRTGAVEKKREMRIKAKQPQKAETYEALLEKEKYISTTLHELESKLAETESKLASEAAETSTEEADSLDSFMLELKDQKPDKLSVKKLRFEIANLQQDLKNVVKLMGIAKPASLPALIADDIPHCSASSSSCTKKSFPLFGKRRKVAVQIPVKLCNSNLTTDIDNEVEEEESEVIEDRLSVPVENEGDSVVELVSFDGFMQKIKALIPNKKYKAIKLKLIEIDHKVGTAVSDGIEIKQFEPEMNRVLQKIADFETSDVTSIIDEFLAQVKNAKVPPKIVKVTKSSVNIDSKSKINVPENVQTKSKGKKRNKVKNSNDGKDYEQSDDYETWVPPTNQSGDGRTSLNDKLGY